MQAYASHKRVDFAQDALAQLLERQVTMFLDEGGKTLFAERFARLVHRFGCPVGEKQHDVANAERLRHLLEQRLEPLAVVDLQAQNETIRRLDLRLLRRCDLGGDNSTLDASIPSRLSPDFFPGPPDLFLLPPSPFPLQIDERTVSSTRLGQRARAHVERARVRACAVSGCIGADLVRA